VYSEYFCIDQGSPDEYTVNCSSNLFESLHTRAASKAGQWRFPHIFVFFHRLMKKQGLLSSPRRLRTPAVGRAAPCHPRALGRSARPPWQQSIGRFGSVYYYYRVSATGERGGGGSLSSVLMAESDSGKTANPSPGPQDGGRPTLEDPPWRWRWVRWSPWSLSSRRPPFPATSRGSFAHGTKADVAATAERGHGARDPLVGPAPAQVRPPGGWKGSHCCGEGQRCQPQHAARPLPR
jgi:hypothetical protein